MKKKVAQKKPPVPKVRCPNPKCGYEWEPRVAYPKSCPECKTRLGWYHGKLTGRRG